MRGAEPFELGNGSTGILLIHGFTGTPQSMRPWGVALANRGFKVSCPLLPGHGTKWSDMQNVRWQDWTSSAEAALERLSRRCGTLFIAGLSMGGAIACYLAAENPGVISGLITVNAALHTEDPRIALLPILKHLIPSFPGVSNDIAIPGIREIAYDRTPLKAAAELISLQRIVRQRLSDVTVPALVFYSAQDHVVPRSNVGLLAQELASSEIIIRRLDRSYHVATLDYDKDEIFSSSIQFIEQLVARKS